MSQSLLSPPPSLLPSGFADLLPQEARRTRLLAEHMLESFRRFGYEEASPPLMEFEAALLAGKGASVAHQTFRLMDPVSREMMGLRTDITTQIIRIASSRLRNAPHPLRLCYAGPCLRVSGEGLRKERQFIQAGAELIGHDSAAADIEIVRCAAAALAPLALGRITVDVNLPGLAEALLEDLPPEDQARAKQALTHKDRALLGGLPQALGESLAALLDMTGKKSDSRQWQTILPVLPEAARSLLQGWLERMAALEAAELPARISLDPLEYQGFEYHSGMAFSIFAERADSEIGRGGRYLLPDGTPATGFTLFLNQLRQARIEEEAPRRCYIPAGAKESAAKSLRAEGWITLYAVDAGADAAEAPNSASSEKLAAAARQQKCTHWLSAAGPVAVD